MKIKFTKNAFGYKADQEIEVTAEEFAQFGDAVVEVKAEAEDVIAKAADELMEKVEGKLTAMEKRVAKAFSNSKANIIVGKENVEDDEKAGFKNFGEYVKAIKQMSKGVVDDRIKSLEVKAQSVTETGGATTDGGALIPTGFTPGIQSAIDPSVNLFTYVDASPIAGRIMTYPYVKKYDFSNSTATAGVVASYLAEGSDGTVSKAQFELLSLTLKKLTAFVADTEELEEDTQALGDFIQGEAAFQINEMITKNILKDVSGGASGILGDGTTPHASVKSQTRVTSGVVGYQDVVRLYANFWGNYGNAVWIVHPTAMPALSGFTSGNQNIYSPQGVGNSANPYPALMGRPIIVSQYAGTKGALGDIGLYDLSKYKAVYKAGGLNTAMSMHLYFLAAQNLYRVMYRWNGKPKLTAPVTLADGSTTQSPFSVLAATYGASSTL